MSSMNHSSQGDTATDSFHENKVNVESPAGGFSLDQIADEKLYRRQLDANRNLRQVIRSRNNGIAAMASTVLYDEYMPLCSSNSSMKVLSTKSSVSDTREQNSPMEADEIKLCNDTSFAVATALASCEFPWFAEILPFIRNMDFLVRLHFECLYLLDWLKPTALEESLRRKVACKIDVIAKVLWNCSEMHIFGSWVTGLSLPDGDLDICLLNIPGDVKMNLKLFAYLLCKLRIAQSIELVTSARVPIVKFIDRETGILADVSINQPSSVSSSDFLISQLQKFKHLSPLILLVKLFLRLRGLNDTYSGGIGSYLLSCMVLNFLQLHPSSVHPELYKHTLLSHLLIDFFFCWGVERNLRQDAASVRGMGYIFPKHTRKEFSNSESGNGFSMESPLDPDVDIGKSAFNYVVIREAFKKAFMELMGGMDLTYANGATKEKHSILKALYDPKHPFFFNRCKPETSLSLSFPASRVCNKLETISSESISVFRSRPGQSTSSSTSRNTQIFFDEQMRCSVAQDIYMRLQTIENIEKDNMPANYMQEKDNCLGMFSFELQRGKCNDNDK
ncbi:polynucleotide adenylyltransferase [Cardiosporidium cionae]|uniref:Polynucleotide adenylyltransferase n=1 Tax=Cardiosporidium cionae TaxID=476202 RepID=A0ABQ7J8U6_9APIC|nr:polynucleotide adenylyltransferase [Cardiosporidium cionae]|eukprot:KAF8820349.1 polynucleotide adenylyltransferase [Cardiosporidium cionae]